MKLSKWAKNKGIAYKTAHKWFQQGMIDGAYQEKNGSIFVNDAPIETTIKDMLDRIEKRLENIMKAIGNEKGGK